MRRLLFPLFAALSTGALAQAPQPTDGSLTYAPASAAAVHIPSLALIALGLLVALLGMYAARHHAQRILGVLVMLGGVAAIGQGVVAVQEAHARRAAIELGNPEGGTVTIPARGGSAFINAAGLPLEIVAVASPFPAACREANDCVRGIVLAAGEACVVTACEAPAAPVANDDSASVVENESVTIMLTGSDNNGDALTFAVGTGPANGSLGAITPVNATSAEVSYTPDAGFNGSDSFTFLAEDGVLPSAPATIAIDVLPANAQPSITIDGTMLIGPGDDGIEATTSYSIGAAPDENIDVSYVFGDPEGASDCAGAPCFADHWFELRFISAPEVDGEGEPFTYLSPFDRSENIAVKDVQLPDSAGGDLGYVQWQSSLEQANGVLDVFRIRLNEPGQYVLEIIVLDNGRSGACPAGIEIPPAGSMLDPDGIRSTVGRNGDLIGGDMVRCLRESSVRITLAVTEAESTITFVSAGAP